MSKIYPTSNSETLTKRNAETGNGYIPCHWKERAEAIDKGENRLAEIEDILGDDYDLDRLKEIVDADREGRLEIKVKARRCPKCGKFQLYPRIDWNYYYCFHCKTQFTKEEAEAALRRTQNEGIH